MKKFFITFYFFVSAIMIYAQQLETVTTYFDDIFRTKKHEEFTVKKGTYIKQGNYKKWDERGSVIEDYNYSNNELNGISKEFYSEGLGALVAAAEKQNPEFYYRRLYRQAEYNNGILKSETFFKYIKEKQITTKEELYDNQGDIISSKEYYINSKPKVIIIREPDKINYAYTFYYENGNIKEKQFNYINNKELVQTGQHSTFYENGSKEVEGQYKKGEKDGIFKVFFPDGKLKGEIVFGEYKDNVLQLNSIEYFENGKVSYKSSFNKEDENFSVESYDSLTYMLSFKSKQPLDYKNGKGVKWYSNDTIMSVREPNGDYKEYFIDGKIKMKGQYNNENKKNGDFTYYDNNGNIIEKITYSNDKIKDKISGEVIRTQALAAQKKEQEKAEKLRLESERKKQEEDRIAEEKRVNDAKMAEMKIMHEKISNNLKLAYSNDEIIFSNAIVNDLMPSGIGTKNSLNSIFDIIKLDYIDNVEVKKNTVLFKYYYMNAILLLQNLGLGEFDKALNKSLKFPKEPSAINYYLKMKSWLETSETLLKLTSNVKQAYEQKDKKTIKSTENELSTIIKHKDGLNVLLKMY